MREYTVTVGTENVVQDVKICLLGDVNLDGVVTIDDATLVQKYLAGISELDDPLQLLAADVDSSGEITIDDSTRIQKYLVGLIDKF